MWKTSSAQTSAWWHKHMTNSVRLLHGTPYCALDFCGCAELWHCGKVRRYGDAGVQGSVHAPIFGCEAECYAMQKPSAQDKARSKTAVLAAGVQEDLAKMREKLTVEDVSSYPFCRAGVHGATHPATSLGG